MNYRKIIRSIGILFVIPALFAACGNSDQQQMSAQQQVQSFPIVNIQPRSVILTTSYPATLEGMQTVEIRPRVSGYITDMHVDEGDWVDKNQVLFTLNNEEFEQEVRSAKADVQAAKARVSTAEDEVERQQNLVEQDIVSNYQLQSAQNSLQASKAALAQARARLENARINLGYTKVKSPVNGMIGTIPYRIGSLVSSTVNPPLTVVSDISKVYAYFSMSERELLSMAQRSDEQEGQTLQERVEALPDVNLILADNSLYDHKGNLKLASGLINQQTGSASFRAVFPNPNEILRTGGSAEVQIPYRQESAVVIPKSATYEIQNQRFVYTVTEENVVESSNISVLPLSTKQLFVVEEGLSAGDKLIVSGLGQLEDGMTIKPNTVNADSLYQSLSGQSSSAN